MKTKLLFSSVLVTAVATTLALYGTWSTGAGITEHQVVTNVKLFASAGYLGLLGIGLFFVGAVYPKK